MKQVRELEKRKNRLIRELLKEIVGDKDDKKYKPIITNTKEASQVRELVLNAINALYRDAIIYIAAQEGIFIQSLETLAKQDLPEGFTLEDVIDRGHKKKLERETKVRATRADRKEE